VNYKTGFFADPQHTTVYQLHRDGQVKVWSQCRDNVWRCVLLPKESRGVILHVMAVEKFQPTDWRPYHRGVQHI
jgi:hypothetical protein